jgi:hypothetical protein
VSGYVLATEHHPFGHNPILEVEKFIAVLIGRLTFSQSLILLSVAGSYDVELFPAKVFDTGYFAGKFQGMLQIFEEGVDGFANREVFVVAENSFDPFVLSVHFAHVRSSYVLLVAFSRPR